MSRAIILCVLLLPLLLRAAPPASQPALPPLADRQAHVANDLATIPPRLPNRADVEDIRKALLAADVAMDRAAKELYRGDRPVQEQAQALALLDQAIKDLRERRSTLLLTAYELQRDELIRRYRDFRLRQKAINSETTPLVYDGNLRPWAALSLRQRNLAGEVSALTERLGRILDWINVRIDDTSPGVMGLLQRALATDMETSRQMLAQGQKTRTLTRAQADALTRIDTILAILEQEAHPPVSPLRKPDLRDDTLPVPPKPIVAIVPPPHLVSLAGQLKLLRAEQLLVNADTTAVAADLQTAPDADTRAVLQAVLDELATRQAAIGTHMEFVTRPLR